MAKRRLGKGLNALISNNNLEEDNKDQIKKIELKLIKPNPYQPRKNFDEQELKELSQSIKEHGLIQPIIVRKKEDKYQIIAGERRYRAAKELKLKEIDVIVSDMAEQKMMEIALIENIQRQDLNPIEEAEAYQQLMDKFDLIQAEVAKKVSKSRSTIANSLRLLNLPDKLKDDVSRGTLSMGHARALLSIEDIDLQKKVAKEIVDKQLTVRETEKLIQKLKASNNSKNKKVTKKKDPNVTMVEDKLRDILGTQVAINAGKNKGKIVIEYYSNEDLSRIIDLLDN
ncbi:ParB/RepB/Spo0J family partition protein [Orenia marismortui]|uniref:Chromosome segregation DNA-binding protein n=1 Tax=Orenia marismortui TaxID=46469 RepID=A0A4R8H4H5_9FIRM|nr:ParB/RepB/Spo0J family partition protein [Orenia marismortui]TDX51778.1 chromosome segregation DNA-binding protein [Orenia marismortui]